MTRRKQIIKELNVIFKQRGWKLLSIYDKYSGVYNKTYNIISPYGCQLILSRQYISYNKYLNKFTIEQLDNYVVEFLKPICKKYNITSIYFMNDYNSKNRENSNTIQLSKNLYD